MSNATFKLFVKDIDYLKRFYKSFFSNENGYDQVLAALHLPFEAFFDVLKNSKFSDNLDKSKVFIIISDFYHYDFEEDIKFLIEEEYNLCTLDTFDKFKSYKEFYLFLESFLKESGYEI